MAWTPKVWVNRAVQFAGRRLLTPVAGVANTFDVTRAEGTVFTVGDLPDAASLNDLEGRIDSGFNECVKKTDKTSETLFSSRDTSIAGVQTITGLSGTPKRIEARASIASGTDLAFSVGSWESGNNAQSCQFMYSNSSGAATAGVNNTTAILYAQDQNTVFLGTIQNVTSTQFEINWTGGTVSNTLNLQFIVIYS